MNRLKYLPAVILMAFAFCSNALAQGNKIDKGLYSAATLPDSLKQDANAVVRYSSDEYILKGPGKSVGKHHSIITVLNEKGDRNAMLVLFYDRKFNSVSDIEMVVYNAAGVQQKKYHKSDMYDRAATDGFSIVIDDRLLALRHTIASYPATIEISYETTQNSYLSLDSWSIQRPEEAVQYAEYKISVLPELGFRYQNKNTAIQPDKSTADGFDKYYWHVQNLKAVKPEDDALSWQTTQKVVFATNAFQYAGLSGDFSTWQSFGKWIQGLNADVCTLSPKRVSEIQQMTADLKTDKEKAKFLYEYMQQNMRYVSIQLGIGGFKPFDANFVDDKKYGDCKALSNYMYALLKAVNIPAYYAIIRAGENEPSADAAFPVNQFNHAILCIPFKGDTTWLECTSNTAPFGKLGPFTENRNALLITEDGGKLVNTPRSVGADNRFNSQVHIVLNADGGATAQLKLFNTGEYRSQYLDIASKKLDDQKEYLIRLLNMKQPNTLELTQAADKDGVKEVDINLEYEKFSDISAGNKSFYKPSVFDLWRFTIPAVDHRKTDFYFDHPLQKTCVTTIDLPNGFEVETLPTNQALKFTYGNYEVNYVYDAAKNQVTSTAKFNLNNHIIPAARYTEMQQYMDNVARAQNKKLVIRKKA